jgi:predicted DCC family thiol-disulfide oxidoreductase YuxK
VQTTRSANTLPIVQATLVLDGECAFCRCSVGFLERRVRPVCEIVAWQSADLSALGLTREQCSEAVQWVGAYGTFSGARAIAGVLKSGRPGWRILGRVIDFPLMRPIAAVVYRLVAANRSRLVQFCRE